VGDGVFTQVIPDEAAVRVSLRQCGEGGASTTSSVEHIDAPFEAIGNAIRQGQQHIAELGGDGLTAVLGHHLVEAGIIAVPHPLAALEAREDPILNRPHECDELPVDSQVAQARATGQTGRMLGRQAIGLGAWVERDDAAGDHSRQPLAHVTLRQFRPFGDLSAGGRGQRGQNIEQPGPMADGDHHGDGAGIEHLADTTGEGLGCAPIEFIGVECGGSGHGSSLLW
jgi:hypothetical protein